MNSVHSSNGIIPFPGLSSSLAATHPLAGVGMRRFGIFESDLEINFAAGNAFALVTRILEQCTVDSEGRVPDGFFRRLSIGKRLEFLLTLAAGEKRSPFRFPFHCSGCGEEIEMELTLDEIAEIQCEADLIENVGFEIGGRSFTLRKPCGSDQEDWAKMVFHNEKNVAGVMIRTLMSGPNKSKRFDDIDFDLIEEAMDAADPLVNFKCGVGCSECGAESELVIDLCDVALGILGRLQRQLIVMIHKLASQYHWSEKEIFEIPRWRRTEYLDLIADGS